MSFLSSKNGKTNNNVFCGLDLDLDLEFDRMKRAPLKEEIEQEKQGLYKGLPILPKGIKRDIQCMHILIHQYNWYTKWVRLVLSVMCLHDTS